MDIPILGNGWCVRKMILPYLTRHDSLRESRGHATQKTYAAAGSAHIHLAPGVNGKIHDLLGDGLDIIDGVHGFNSFSHVIGGMLEDRRVDGCRQHRANMDVTGIHEFLAQTIRKPDNGRLADRIGTDVRGSRFADHG